MTIHLEMFRVAPGAVQLRHVAHHDDNLGARQFAGTLFGAAVRRHRRLLCADRRAGQVRARTRQLRGGAAGAGAAAAVGGARGDIFLTACQWPRH